MKELAEKFKGEFNCIWKNTEKYKTFSVSIKKRSLKARLIFASGLAWQAVLKKTTVTLELLTDVNMLLMVEKGIRGVTCYAICQYVKSN